MTKSKFRPLHDRVVVKRIDAEEKTKGGIIIPDSAKEKPSQGEITAVGPGGRDEAGKLIPIDLKVGDRVLFGKWSGTEIKLDGEELLIMKESLRRQRKLPSRRVQEFIRVHPAILRDAGKCPLLRMRLFPGASKNVSQGR
jgi:chaperonin GroES